MQEYEKKYQEWCHNPLFDVQTRMELSSLQDPKEIKDRFYQDLSFGTAGLRGIMGAGTNRLNIYTVTKATQGLANYIKKQQGEKQGVAIAYDSRHQSPEFAQAAALCLNANQIRAYVFESLRPTPELSFAVRELGCIAGIVITASHNPAEYNGYKVYWEDGAQICSPIDQEIIAEVRTVEDFAAIKKMSLAEAQAAGLYQTIGAEIDERYQEELAKLILSPELISTSDLKLVYTPLHGSGNLPIQEGLKRLGFKNFWVVPEQEQPDGNFPTVSYPNPESPLAFALALQLAQKVQADLVMATDPDGDRLGLYVRDQEGQYQAFTGNMSGLLIAEYQLARKKELGLLPAKPQDGALIKTIVSSKMADALAEAYGITLIEVLTGFKYIGEQIKLFKERQTANGGKLEAAQGAYEFLFGYEESYGCLVGTHARDKDAVIAVLVLAEAAAYYQQQGLSLWEQMLRMYQKYGYYQEDLFSLTLKGADGAEQIQKIIQELQENPPRQIGSYAVLKVRDYQKGEITDLGTGKKSPTKLPAAKVLYWELAEEGWCCVRPSGTEPKIKFYIGVRGNSLLEAEKLKQELKTALEKMVEGLTKGF